MRKRYALLVALALGCGGTSAGDPPGGTADMAGGGGGGSDGPVASTELSGTVSGVRDLSGEVRVTGDLTIDSGATVTLAAGTRVLVAKGKQIAVRGTLAVSGTAAQPVTIAAQTPTGGSDWEGLAVYGGGTLTLHGAQVRNAKVGLQTAAGASFDLDGVLFEQSAALAYLSSGGTIRYSVFHGMGGEQSGSPVLITDASPQISDSLFDHANIGTDMLVVTGATASPVFDHLEVTQSHCAFHFNSGARITISGSNVHDNIYGLMVMSSKNTQVSGNNFTQNTINIGSCAPDGTVTANGNFFVGEIFESNCSSQTATGAKNSPLPAVGPRPHP